MSKAKNNFRLILSSKLGEKTNGGQICDMEVGPCACGAWHTEAETIGVKEEGR